MSTVPCGVASDSFSLMIPIQGIHSGWIAGGNTFGVQFNFCIVLLFCISSLVWYVWYGGCRVWYSSALFLQIGKDGCPSTVVVFA
eukprot:scaffold1982_cov93-Amphora_coffeaeformis.AAC.43